MYVCKGKCIVHLLSLWSVEWCQVFERSRLQQLGSWLLATNNEQQEFKVKFKVRVVSYRRIVLTARVGDVSANIQTNEEAGQ